MSKKRIMREFKMREISAVDNPAQEGARKLIMKRAPEQDPSKDPNKLKTKENEMTKEEMEKAIADAVEKALGEEKVKSEAALAVAKKEAELTDAEKALYAKMDEKGKSAFLAKSAEQRKTEVEAEIAKAAEKDPVAYTADDGTQYRKSAGDAMIAMAKRNDELAKGLAVEKAAREDADLKKRATAEFANLPGDDVAKAALLKSVEGIADEKVRKAAMDAIKAGNNAMSGAFVRKGSSNTPNDAGHDNEAVGELDALAKKYASEKKVDYAKAYTAVCETPEGKALYEKSLQK